MSKHPLHKERASMPQSAPLNDNDKPLRSATKPRGRESVAASGLDTEAYRSTRTAPCRHCHGHGWGVRFIVRELLCLTMALDATASHAATLTSILRRPAANIYAVAPTSHWCGRRVHLLWKSQDPLLFNQPKRFLRLMQMTSKRLSRSCPRVDAVALRGVDASDGALIYRGKATKAGHWRPSPPFSSTSRPGGSSPPLQ